MYCDRPACRKAASRAHQEAERLKREEEQTRRLRTLWQSYPDAARAKLEALLSDSRYGLDTAQACTEIVELVSDIRCQAKVNEILRAAAETIVRQYVKPL
jgi:hypothetical protein